jgi:hypothetical protein
MEGRDGDLGGLVGSRGTDGQRIARALAPPPRAVVRTGATASVEALGSPWIRRRPGPMARAQITAQGACFRVFVAGAPIARPFPPD